MKAVLRLLFAVALAGFAFTFAIEASFEGRTTRIQLVRKGPDGALGFVGDPVEIVDVPAAATVQAGGLGRAALVDIRALESHGPVLKTDSIRSFAWPARLGCLLAAISVFVGMRLYERYRVGPIEALTED